MGYVSDVRFAVRKDIYLKCQLLQNLPAPLAEFEATPYEDSLYWFIGGWKWYQSFPDVQAMENWFSWLADEEENPPEKNKHGHEKAAFGGIRVGEDYGDVETWGTPGDFDIYVNTVIDSPV